MHIPRGELRRLLAAAPLSTLAGARDRALLLLDCAAGLRRGELVAIAASDLEETVTRVAGPGLPEPDRLGRGRTGK